MIVIAKLLIYASLLINLSLASRTLVPAAIRGLHHSTIRRTHNLASDLRLAFRGILLPRTETNEHIVYCKSGKQAPFNGGGDDSGGADGNTSSAVGTSGRQTTVIGSGSSTSRRPLSSASSSSPSATATLPPSLWKLTNSYQGNNFFDGWDFFIGDDPTHGTVDYVDENTARSNGLLEINGQGNAVMRVETTGTVSGNRKSVRITTKAQFTGGLVIMDSVHMPTGCGIWPAFWTNGPNWPAGGEIDIVEGVHDYTNNQATIHTNSGCTLASTSSSTLAITGSVIAGTDCAALTTGNQGCGIRASSSNSFGPGFNSNGGGIYAMKWDSSGIAVWFFARGTEPADISSDAPQPDSWGAALARWPAASCDPFKFFSNHNAIFDTTLCGDWAGAVWNTAGIPGQEQSCAQRTGVSTCEAFVRANGGAMANAYWEVKSVKLYQMQT
ncbi:putative glycosidase C21B10.07 [Psilocybe cubensis]|uniref:GH16 domain-containing protein n=2 Tax=Psilocybe cubensis TaxID=181762 RepID=A0A8H7YA43_PSICU|nr:putative glycosidase C21B10.07 [Psilocybe cubensis]KAH9486693.1 putative glycosidase C21B10.07 [Psilocybe cubensis]